jgi:hypothetical protein
MSRMNESCHIDRSHVTDGRERALQWVMSRIYESCLMDDESCHIPAWSRGMTGHFNESCHVWMSQVMHEFVSLHIYESRHIKMWVVSRIEWIMPHTGMSRVNEYCHEYDEWVISYTYIIEGRNRSLQWVTSRINESCHIWIRHASSIVVMSHVWVMCESCMSHVS